MCMFGRTYSEMTKPATSEELIEEVQQHSREEFSTMQPVHDINIRELHAKYQDEHKAIAELRFLRSRLDHGLMSMEDVSREYGAIAARLPESLRPQLAELSTYAEAVDQKAQFEILIKNHPLIYALARSGMTMEGIIVELVRDRERLMGLIGMAQLTVQYGSVTVEESGRKQG